MAMRRKKTEALLGPPLFFIRRRSIAFPQALGWLRPIRCRNVPIRSRAVLTPRGVRQSRSGINPTLIGIDSTLTGIDPGSWGILLTPRGIDPGICRNDPWLAWHRCSIWREARDSERERSRIDAR